MKYQIKYSEEVLKAIQNNLPVVALESTIISHGMPYPDNLEVARKCEKIIRENGAVPATIAIIKGQIVVGINEEELEYMASSKDILKVSRRDLPYVISQKLSGATTVATTSLIANLAGIHFFATGGIGGVHRGVSETWDISADLEELGMTNICVVSAGAKSILDLPKTLEYLETKGVPVVGYNTSIFPAFFCNESSEKVPLRLDTPKEISDMIKVKWDLGLNGGILVANPIDRKYSLSKEMIDNVINEAILEMNSLNIIGKEVTPFLLAKINEITKGNSLAANKQLVYSNCKLAAQIAKVYFE